MICEYDFFLTNVNYRNSKFFLPIMIYEDTLQEIITSKTTLPTQLTTHTFKSEFVEINLLTIHDLFYLTSSNDMTHTMSIHFHTG